MLNLTLYGELIGFSGGNNTHAGQPAGAAAARRTPERLRPIKLLRLVRGAVVSRTLGLRSLDSWAIVDFGDVADPAAFCGL